MYTPTLEEARKLMEEHNQEPFHRQHAETVSGVMGYFAKEYDPENEEFWRCVGMLHDLDFEEFPEEHCVKELQWLNDYHQTVYDRLAPHLDADDRQWLAQRCAPITH